jgi:hypothetical protein
MGDSASLELCAEFCAGYAYMGLQWADQCSCGNAHGAYGQLEDVACGVRGDACGQNNTQTDACAMMNAVFRLPAPWTCTDYLRTSPCLPGTAARRGAADISALGSTAEAQAACCDLNCVAWSTTEACAEGTLLIARFAETIAAETGTCSGVFTGKLTVAGDNAYIAYINGEHVISDARAAGNDNTGTCEGAVNWLGDSMSGCNWQVRPFQACIPDTCSSCDSMPRKN